MRKGFGIVYAVIILVLIGTIATYTLELSSKSVKSVSDEHIKIQLQLYQNSAVEYAILWLSENKNRSNPSEFGLGNSSDLNITYDDIYKFQIKMYETSLTDISESNGTVIMDIIGKFEGTSEPIVVVKRLVVKP